MMAHAARGRPAWGYESALGLPEIPEGQGGDPNCANRETEQPPIDSWSKSGEDSGSPADRCCLLAKFS